jgi:uracil-DNA glycosylase family 4
MTPGCFMVRDLQQVQRKVIHGALDSDVFAVGQSPGRTTQRLSGLPFVSPAGKLSPGGRAFDGFLSLFGYTVDPTSPLRCVYVTDLVKRYPGRSPDGTADREPTSREIEKCAEWLHAELLIMRPKVVILLGKLSAQHFLARYADVQVCRLSDVAGRGYACSVGSHMTMAFAVYHPSRAWQYPKASWASFEAAAKEISRALAVPYPGSIPGV